MKSAPIRLLCAADLHLGRRLISLPEEMHAYARAPLDAWKRLVNFASEQKVDAVILAGDIFDSEEDLYEAAAEFERGAKHLLEHKIPLIAVAGNHDVVALSKCCQRIGTEYCCLLGEGGVWESAIYEFQGRKIRFDGWSFPKAHYENNPLKFYSLAKPESSVEKVIGILHCDCSSQGKYAPVTQSEFQQLVPHAWVLGHLHAPRVLLNTPLTFYAGSLQGLDPTEYGPRGVFLLEIEEEIAIRHIPLAPVLWSNQEISSDKFDEEEVFHFLRSTLEKEASSTPATELVLLRLLFSGRMQNYREIPSWIHKVEGRELLSIGRNGIPCFVESVINRARPDLPLESLSQGRDLIGSLSRELIQLQTSPSESSLLKRARHALAIKLQKNGNLGEDVDDAEILESLLKSGFELLDWMLQESEK